MKSLVGWKILHTLASLQRLRGRAGCLAAVTEDLKTKEQTDENSSQRFNKRPCLREHLQQHQWSFYFQSFPAVPKTELEKPGSGRETESGGILHYLFCFLRT